jgi:hypothetical protein
MQRLPEGTPGHVQSNDSIATALEAVVEQFRDRSELQQHELALTMYRCRGWRVRSECATFYEARVRSFMLMKLIRIDFAHVRNSSRPNI